jgi:tetratricopeptide (TPR) repeat protein
MALAIRNRCLEMLIVMLAVATPAFAQIEARGSLSGCNKENAPPDYRMPSLWARMVDALNNQPKSSPHSSLASYCVAELLLQQREYQASVNAFRDALRGDGNPAWTKVWSLIQIGKIFDITGQRERAVAQYQLAIQTGDNNDGAVNEARELSEHPFEWPANQ